jgi:thioredoxin-dependent peroxiredoxin
MRFWLILFYLTNLALFTLTMFTLTLAQSLNEGDDAYLPALQDSYDHLVNLADIPASGKWLVLWFYPKALTAGCSIQAKHYTDMAQDLSAARIQAFGVSADNPEEQCQFIEQLKLSGQMLPDDDGSLAKAYGVTGVFYNRDTVLINPQGKVEKIWRNVNPGTDADTVLEYVRSHF